VIDPDLVQSELDKRHAEADSAVAHQARLTEMLNDELRRSLCQVDDLKAELKAAREQLDGYRNGELVWHDGKDWRVDTLRERLALADAELTEVLDYAGHLNRCVVGRDLLCNCGWDAMRKRHREGRCEK